jgi:hypothetical protein
MWPPERSIMPAAVDVGRDVAAHPLAVEQLVLVHAVTPPERLLGLQLPHLLVVEGREDRAVPEVAGDVVLRDALADDPPALLDHPAHEVGDAPPVARPRSCRARR